MSIPASSLPRMTAVEYLVWEDAQPARHGYFRGEAFAMAGAKPRHNAIAARILGALDDVLVNPTVVVEVLSENTESYDRGLKWEANQVLPSLRDYLLVAQASARIEHFFRQPDGLELDVDAIFAGVFALPGD